MELSLGDFYVTKEHVIGQVDDIHKYYAPSEPGDYYYDNNSNIMKEVIDVTLNLGNDKEYTTNINELEHLEDVHKIIYVRDCLNDYIKDASPNTQYYEKVIKAINKTYDYSPNTFVRYVSGLVFEPLIVGTQL